MSYGELPLDEQPTANLVAELKRRRIALSTKQCPYCHKPISEHTCKFSKVGTYDFDMIFSGDPQLAVQVPPSAQRWTVHYDTLGEAGKHSNCPMPEHCDCECVGCLEHPRRNPE